MKKLLLLPLVLVAFVAAGCDKYKHEIDCQAKNGTYRVEVYTYRTRGASAKEQTNISLKTCQAANNLLR